MKKPDTMPEPPMQEAQATVRKPYTPPSVRSGPAFERVVLTSNPPETFAC